MSQYLDIDALWRVATLSLVFGVGVVGLYALGIAATTASSEGGRVSGARRGVGYSCFAICAAVIVFGVRVMLTK